MNFEALNVPSLDCQLSIPRGERRREKSLMEFTAESGIVGYLNELGNSSCFGDQDHLHRVTQEQPEWKCRFVRNGLQEVRNREKKPDFYSD